MCSQVPHTNDYYVKCMFGGVLSCGLTHTLVVPLDVVKCNMQVPRRRGCFSRLTAADQPQGVHGPGPGLQDAVGH